MGACRLIVAVSTSDAVVRAGLFTRDEVRDNYTSFFVTTDAALMVLSQGCRHSW